MNVDLIFQFVLAPDPFPAAVMNPIRPLNVMNWHPLDGFDQVIDNGKFCLISKKHVKIIILIF
jgi:hypothetical protein